MLINPLFLLTHVLAAASDCLPAIRGSDYLAHSEGKEESKVHVISFYTHRGLGVKRKNKDRKKKEKKMS